jgi:hypothetical protein
MTGVDTITWENGLIEDRTPSGVASAVFSPDRAYRYLLRRTWQPNTELMLFLMLNPSTADALHDDHTIRRCSFYARRQGYGGMSVANLFGLRATDPRKLLTADDPVGPDNWRVLTTLALRDPGRMIIAAWGDYDRRLGVHADLVTELFVERGHTLHRLGAPTTSGHPRHPARQPNNTPLEVHAAGRPITSRDPLAELTAAALQPCHAEGMCPRLVSRGTQYCCGPCGDGWEANPRYEPHAHTAACDARWAEREGLVRRG